MAADVYSRVNEAILAALEQGVIPWRRPWTGSLPKNYDSGKDYKGINVLTLGIAEMVHGYSSPFWMTFLQANKYGGHIKRGEHATYIVFSDRKVKEVEKEDGTKEMKTWHVVRSYPVFNWEQTENVPKKETGPALDPDRDLIEVCNSVLNKMPNPPNYRESGSRAYYMPKEDLVNLPPIGTFKTTSKVVFLPPRLTTSSKATLEFSGFKFTPAMASVKIRTFRPSLSASNAEYLTQ
jgi:antirestriction protein ArdC